LALGPGARIGVQWGVRLGIRAQLLFAIGGLLVLAFAPLFFAVASLTRAGLTQAWERHARELGRVIAGHVSEARSVRSPEQLRELLEVQVGDAVGSIGVYGRGGELELRAGSEGALAALPAAVDPNREQVLQTNTARGPAMIVVVPGTAGPVGTLLHTDPSVVRVAPLVRLVALYTALLALALLVFLYIVLTRIVVSPLDRLSGAAKRVAEGARELAVPRLGGRELVDLGSSLATMTAALRAEELALREKVDELQTTTDDLRRAQDTVIRGERLASVGRLSAGLAHEIGNPISAILSFQDLLLDGELGEDERDFVQRMKRETERVHRILRDLLDFARPVAKLADDELKSASVSDVVEHVASLLRPQKSFNDVELTIVVEEGLPAVPMQRERLEQVLLNLLLNASDVVPKPGGRIALRAERSEVGVQIHIEDNGGGVDPEVVDRLFEPFVTTKDVGEGTGLGLAVCRGLIESAGGSIDVEDGAEGAHFVLLLPALSLEDDAQ